MTESSPKKLQVAFAAAEATPFVKTGGLGDVAGSLPAELARAGADVVVFVPKYDVIDERYTSAMTHLTDFTVRLSWRKAYCGLEELDLDGVRYLFVDNEQYFKRGYPYGFFDDGERFAFFSAAIVESLRHIPGFECDVLHCNDWHTALAPVFLRELYQGDPLYENVKTVFSIHNIAFQGQFSASMIDDVCGLDRYPAAVMQLSSGYDSMNCMQGALNYADAIATVSPTYAQEIQTPEYGEGLDGLLRWRSSSLYGIVNGLDTKSYDPATNPCLTAPYSVEDRAGKAACKAALQEELGLEVDPARPLAIMVSRLTRQKGVDLVVYALDRILDAGVQVAVLGTGDVFYEDVLCDAEARHPGRMAARIDFDNALSQRMYSGADLLLMPSLFEPCGISQLIAMRYGTLPVVRETGGLKDTVAPYNSYTGEGTGFSFANFNGDEFADTVLEAAAVYRDDQDAWQQLVAQAMSQDFGWERSAAAYMDLYYGLHPELRPAASEDGEAANGETEGGDQAVPFPVDDADGASQTQAAVSEETQTTAETATADDDEASAKGDEGEATPNGDLEAAKAAAELVEDAIEHDAVPASPAVPADLEAAGTAETDSLEPAAENAIEHAPGAENEAAEAAAHETGETAVGDDAAESASDADETLGEASDECDDALEAADETAAEGAAAGSEAADEAAAESLASVNTELVPEAADEAAEEVENLAAPSSHDESPQKPQKEDDEPEQSGKPETTEALDGAAEENGKDDDSDTESCGDDSSDEGENPKEDKSSEDEGDERSDDEEEDGSGKNKDDDSEDEDSDEDDDEGDGSEDDDSDEDEDEDEDDKPKKPKKKSKKSKKTGKSGKKEKFTMKDESSKSDKKSKKSKSSVEDKDDKDDKKAVIGAENEPVEVDKGDSKNEEPDKKDNAVENGEGNKDDKDGAAGKKDKKVKRSKKGKKKGDKTFDEDGDVIVKKVVKKTKKKTVKKVKGGSNDAESAEGAGQTADGGITGTEDSAKR